MVRPNLNLASKIGRKLDCEFKLGTIESKRGLSGSSRRVLAFLQLVILMQNYNINILNILSNTKVNKRVLNFADFRKINIDSIYQSEISQYFQNRLKIVFQIWKLEIISKFS